MYIANIEYQLPLYDRLIYSFLEASQQTDSL